MIDSVGEGYVELEINGIRCCDHPELDRPVPTVSAILDILFPASKAWIDQAALDEGTLCHAGTALALRQWIIGGFSAISRDVYEPRIIRLLDWIRTMGFVPVEVERRRVHAQLGYAGRPDAVMRLEQAARIIVPDWKFAESIEERYEYQAQAYAPLVDCRARPLIVQIPREGDVKPHPVKSDAFQWSNFISALNVAKHRIRSAGKRAHKENP